MDLKYLNTFRTIVDEGSFTKAAEKLNYTQSTITLQINQLEQELSTKLFEKIGRKMVLTKSGERLIPYVNDVLASVGRLQSFEEDISQSRETLHIGVAETLLSYKLPLVLKTFHTKAPKARLFLHTIDYLSLDTEITNGIIDIGIVYSNTNYLGDNIITYPMGTYPMALLASPALKKQFPDFITPDRHIPVSYVCDEPNSSHRLTFEQYLKDRSITLDHTIDLWSISTILSLVKNDVGVTYLPRFTALSSLDDGSLVEIPTGMPDTVAPAVCLHHKNKWISPVMKLFIDLCRQVGIENGVESGNKKRE